MGEGARAARAVQRRGRATGSIRERYGNLNVQVFAGTDPVTGRKRHMSETVRGTSERSWREARRARNELLRRAEQMRAPHGHANDHTDVTLGEILDEWLRRCREEVAIEKRSPSTLSTDEDNAKYLEPLRPIRVRQLEANRVTALYRELERNGRQSGMRPGKPLSPSTIQNVNRTLQAALNAATQWDPPWLAANPIHRATKPKVRNPIRSVGDEEQWEAIYGWFEGTEYQDYLELAVITRMRRGELVALQWRDIEWDQQRLLVWKAVARGREEDGTQIYQVRHQTKTDVERYIGLDADTLGQLRARRRHMQERALALGTKLVRDAFVFSDEPDGSVPWRPERFTHAWLWMRQQLSEEGIRVDLRASDATRHRGTTLLIRARKDPAVVAYENGHSLDTLFKHYGHELRGGNRECRGIARPHGAEVEEARVS
jgi:integrase